MYRLLCAHIVCKRRLPMTHTYEQEIVEVNIIKITLRVSCWCSKAILGSNNPYYRRVNKKKFILYRHYIHTYTFVVSFSLPYFSVSRKYKKKFVLFIFIFENRFVGI